MLHSVLNDGSWDYAFLATPMADLARLVADLRGRGYSFVKASEWPTLGKGNFASISFDDGYLDNWTILFPWMRDNKVPFTVFINRDFVVDDNVCRPFGLRIPGYLNTQEVRSMADSGIVDFQSHSCTHTWYPTSGNVIDIYDSKKKPTYPWMQWNSNVSRKHEWLTYTTNELNGYPVFENDRSLRAIRFLLPLDAITDFNLRVAREKLTVAKANELFQEKFATYGKMETVEQALERYSEEISGNGDFIEALTGRRPSILCWPGGAYNEYSLKLAESLGLITTSKIGYGAENRFLHRISPTNHYGKDRWPWKDQALTLSYYLTRYRFNNFAYRMRKVFT